MQIHRRHWLRHTATVPKGFIRYHVLEALSEKPMSGSEIMVDIEKKTGGRWRPSPGSVYPLLAWLQDNRYIKELSVESGMKRYKLTDSGIEFLDEQRRIERKLKSEARFFPPPFMGPWWVRLPPEKTSTLRKSIRRIFTAFFEFGANLDEEFSEQTVEEVRKVLDDASEKLEKINKKGRTTK